MRLVRPILCLLIVAATIAHPVPVHAGGGGWTFVGHHPDTDAVLVVGEVAHARTLLSLEGVEEHGDVDTYWAGPSDGPFLGYLSSRAEGRRFYAPPLPKDAVYVGDVSFVETDEPKVLEVQLDFVVPDVAPGHYTLHHCNDPCTRQIGDTMSTPVTIVSDVGQALTAARVDRLERTLDKHRANSYRRTAKLERRVERLVDRIRWLETRVDLLESKPSPEEEDEAEALAWPALAGLAGSAVVLALAGRRRRLP